MDYSKEIADILRNVEERKKHKTDYWTLPRDNTKYSSPAEPDKPYAETIPRWSYYRAEDESLPKLSTNFRKDPKAIKEDVAFLPKAKKEDPRFGSYYSRYLKKDNSKVVKKSSESSVVSATRSRLISLLQRDDLFDECSFFTVMVFALTRMYRAVYSVVAMVMSVFPVFSIFVCISRFILDKVGDIIETADGATIVFKIGLLIVELAAIFVNVFVFLWAIFIPVCDLVAVIFAKILYFFS